MAKTDIVIIGAGVIGVCCAYELAQKGRAVTLLDRGKVGGGASYGNAGLISLGHPPIPRPGVMGQGARMMFSRQSPLYMKPTLSPTFWRWLIRFRRACSEAAFKQNMRATAELSWLSGKLLDGLVREAGAKADYHDTGFIEVCRSQAGLDHAVEDAQLLGRYGFEARPISEAEAIEREPALKPGLYGAVHHPMSRFCDPVQFVRGLASACVKKGVRIREGVEVATIETDRGRAVGVRTTAGELIEAGTTVLAAGAWTPALAKQAGVRAPIQPAKGYHRDVRVSGVAPHNALLLVETKVAVTPMNGRVRFAGTLEFSGLNDKRQARRLELLTQRADEYLLGSSGEVVSEWMGMRPCTPDGMPIIDHSPRLKGVFVAAGHAMLGLTFGPATGRIVAQRLSGEEPGLDMAPFRADRF